MTISRSAGSVITPKAWMVVHPGMAGEVTADFPSLRHQGGDLIRPEHDGLEEALQWAHRVLASDPHVAEVTIRQSIQEHDGQMWKAGRHVQPVTRNDPVTTPDDPAAGQQRAATPRRRAPRAGAGPPGAGLPARPARR